MEKEKPASFRYGSALKGVIDDKHVTRVAIGLGVLLIIGGIFLGIRTNRAELASLPGYNPSYLSPATSAPASSPEAMPTSQSTPDTQPNNPKANSDSTKEATRHKAKKITSSMLASPSNKTSPLPGFSPESGLPFYTAVAILPNYLPAFIASPTPSPISELEPSPTPTAQQTISVNLAVSGKSYRLAVHLQTTVLEVLQAATKQGLSYKTQHFSGLGDKIIEINGQTEGGGYFWTYTVNGVFASKGVTNQTVSEGDVIVWTLS
jgi:hypothetical protein